MKTDEDEQTNRIHLILGFMEFECSPDEFTTELQLQPSSTGIRGEEYLLPDGNRKKTRDCNHWEYEWKIRSNEFIGDYLTKFTNEIIKPRIGAIKRMNADCVTRITIVQYYYTGFNLGIGFEKEEIQILSAIDAEIDIDIYVLTENE